MLAPPSQHLIKLYPVEASDQLAFFYCIRYHQLTRFSQNDSLKRMFKVFLPSTAQLPPIPLSTPLTALPSFYTLSPPGLAAVCRLVDILTSPNFYSPQISTPGTAQTLNSLALGSSLVRSMWAVLSNSREFYELGKLAAPPKAPASAFGTSPTFSSFGSSPSFGFGSPAFSSFSSSPPSPSITSIPSTAAPPGPDFEAVVVTWARCYSQVCGARRYLSALI